MAEEEKVFAEMDVSFVLGGTKYAFQKCLVSAFAIYNIAPREGLDFAKVGMKTPVVLTAKGSVLINATGNLNMEHSNEGSFWGMTFPDPYAPEISKIKALIKKQGIAPSWKRKTPRVPSLEELKTVPVKAAVKVGENLLVADVKNISMGGVKLEIESPMGKLVMFGSNISVYLQSRVDFRQIEFTGTVVHVIEDTNPKTSSEKYTLGVQFATFSEENKSLYIDTIKKVLDEITNKMKK